MPTDTHEHLQEFRGYLFVQIQTEIAANGINLSRRLFASQALAEYISRLSHSVVFFGSAFDNARLVAVGSLRVHFELAQLRAGPSRSQSAQCVGKTNTLHGNLLPVRSLHHDGAYQIVNQGEHGEFLENALHRFATQHVHFHRLF